MCLVNVIWIKSCLRIEESLCVLVKSTHNSALKSWVFIPAVLSQHNLGGRSGWVGCWWWGWSGGGRGGGEGTKGTRVDKNWKLVVLPVTRNQYCHQQGTSTAINKGTSCELHTAHQSVALPLTELLGKSFFKFVDRVDVNVIAERPCGCYQTHSLRQI